MAKGVFVRLACVEAAGRFTGGALLSQLAYLQERDGPGFHVTTADLSEQTGLSRSEVRLWLPRLADKGLIEYRSARGDRSTGGLYVTVNLDGNGSPGDNLHDTQIRPSRCADPTIAMVGSDHRSLYKRSREEEEMAAPSGRSNASVPEKRSSSVGEALEKAERRRPSKPVSATKVSELRRLWQRLHEEQWPGAWVRPWTRREEGQARHLIRTVPEAELVPALEAALRAWGAYVAYVEARTTAFDAPSRPDLGFLVRFAQEMVNFARERAEVEEKEAGGTAAEQGLPDYMRE